MTDRCMTKLSLNRNFQYSTVTIQVLTLFCRHANEAKRPANLGQLEEIAPSSLDPNWRPLSQASEEQRTFIWSKVLRYAMSPQEPPRARCLKGPSSLRLYTTWQHVRASLVRVCKDFNVRPIYS